jgi:hypothetical protein
MRITYRENMDENAIQRAKAIHEEETEYWIGIDPGCEGEEGICLVRLREGEIEEVSYLSLPNGPTPTAIHTDEVAIYNWADEPYEVFHEERTTFFQRFQIALGIRPGRFRRLYLAVRSSLRELGDAILGKGYFRR